MTLIDERPLQTDSVAWGPPAFPPPPPVPPRARPQRTPARPAVPRKLGGTRREEQIELLVALTAATYGVAFLRLLLDWDGLLGSFLTGYLMFTVIHSLLVWQRSTKEIALDRLVTTVIWSVGATVTAALGWMLSFVVLKGARQLSWSFFTQDLSTFGALDTEGGGASHALVGTVEQVGIAVVFVVPIALLTAVYLHEFRGRLAGPTRFVIDALAGLPSIVAGLLIFTIWPGYAGIKASAALLILMLPPVTRASEEILRTVPDSLREASLALGAPRWKVVLAVVLPTARAGLLTAVLLGIARAVGETAPVLLTAFGSQLMNQNPLADPQASLPTFVWGLIRVANKTQNDRAWGGALVLVLLVMILFATARIVAARGDRRLGRK